MAIRNTDEQIKLLHQMERNTADKLRHDIRRVVDNAVIADRNGDPRPLAMLRKIVDMEMSGGVTNYQLELKKALDELAPRAPERYNFKRETERLFLQGLGLSALRDKYREVYGEDPLPLSALGTELKKKEYVDGLIEAIIDKVTA